MKPVTLIENEIYYHISRRTEFEVGKTYQTLSENGRELFKNSNKSIKEEELEKCRFEHFPTYPSRNCCLYVLYPNEASKIRWIKSLDLLSNQRPYIVYKVECTGSILFRSSYTLIEVLDGTKQPKEYWSEPDSKYMDEGLFVGKFKILGIINQIPQQQSKEG